jgi:hypothetical protein
MRTRKTEVAQEKTRKSLHHQRQCRLCLDERSEHVVGRTGASGWVAEERLKSEVYAGLRRVRRRVVARCEYVKVCVGPVHQKVWLGEEQQARLVIEAARDRLATAQMNFRSRVAKPRCLPGQRLQKLKSGRPFVAGG